MRNLFVAPLLVTAGLALAAAGCTKSQPTAPVADVPKPTQLEMGGGKAPNAPGAAGRSKRTIE